MTQVESMKLLNPEIAEIHEEGCNTELCTGVDETVGTCQVGTELRYAAGFACASGEDDLMNLLKQEFFNHIGRQ